MADIIGIVALVVAILLAVVFVVTVSVLCFMICHYKKRLSRLSKSVHNLSEMGRKATVSMEHKSQQSTTPVNQQDPPAPPPTTVATVTVAGVPPLTQAPPQPPNYSVVNVGDILPHDVRTKDNLQGTEEEIPESLLECNRIELLHYEDMELKALSKTVREREKEEGGGKTGRDAGGGGGGKSTVKAAVTSARQLEEEEEEEEKEEEDPYKEPADALSEEQQTNPSSSKSGKTSPLSSEGVKKISMKDDYTEVFDSVFSAKGTASRTFSDTGPVQTRFNKVSANGGGGGGLVNGGGGGGLVNGGGGGGGGEWEHVAVSSLPANSVEDVMEGGVDVRSKTYSAPNRKSRKSEREVVELDSKTHKFRMTSQKRKQKHEGPEEEVVRAHGNRYESIDGDQAAGSDVGKSPSSTSSSPDPLTPEHRAKQKMKQFELSTESPDSYAVVNVADKQQYRTEADSMKMEGSGPPRHYSASKEPSRSPGETTVI